jgi:hypothetical protein
MDFDIFIRFNANLNVIKFEPAFASRTLPPPIHRAECLSRRRMPKISHFIDIILQKAKGRNLVRLLIQKWD